MPQVRQQGSDADREVPSPESFISPKSRRDSTGRRSLTGSFISSDYPGQRQSPSYAGKPMPSPLYTDFRTQPQRDDPGSSQMSSPSPGASHALPHASPTVVPDAYNRSQDPLPTTDYNLPAVSEAVDTGLLQDENESDKRNTAEGGSHRPPRSASVTGTTNQAAIPSPGSPVGSLHSLPGGRLAQRIMPRASSIDSAISSLSSSQSQKSFDASVLTAADIRSLIAAAGSAEAVIVHLLKEKHNAASQNSQLWRLVDKQRALILSLNKDLERALKEKERYKRKTTELQRPMPPLPTTDLQLTEPRSGALNDPPGHAAGERSQENIRTVKNAHASGAGIHDSKPLTTASDMRPDDFRESSRDHSSQVMIQAAGTQAPSAFLAGCMATGQKTEVPHPNRKSPPAPLNLKRPEQSAVEQAEISDSESEYGDNAGADDSAVEREEGKAWDNDDADQGAVVHHKEASKLFRRESEYGFSEALDDISVPRRHIADARQATSQSPSNIQRFGNELPALSSVTASLAPDGGNPFMSVAKNPGLPRSPRPDDRPLSSVLPRTPKEAPSSLPVSHVHDSVSSLGHSLRASEGQIPNNPVLYNPAFNRGNSSTDSSDPPHAPTRSIYRGFMCKEYPGLLLPPSALPVVQVKVSSSRLRASRNSYTASNPLEEEPVFILSISPRSSNLELWRVEKVTADLPDLDRQIKELCPFGEKLPDRSLFIGNSPAKVDVRRAALNAYFNVLLNTAMDERAATVVCQFLSSDAIEPRDDETSLLGSNSRGKNEMLYSLDGKPQKEGYLTKRGKNFGGWKARYFVLHGPELKYFEAPGGTHMGTIKIQHAQIGKQSESTTPQSYPTPKSDEEIENQYRHAFLILEPKRKDSSALVRHVLCAESDEERDAWVESLLHYVESPMKSEDPSSTIGGQSQMQDMQANSAAGKPSPLAGPSKKNSKGPGSVHLSTPAVQGFSYDNAVAAEPPVLGSPYEPAKSSQILSGLDPKMARSWSPTAEHAGAPYPVISGPTNGAVIQNAGAWGNKTTTMTKEKKRGIWGFRTRSVADLASQVQPSYDTSVAQGVSRALSDRKDIVRPVFGMPLGEAVQVCAPHGVDVELPAVVYRCIEFLDAMDAAMEEGIFRLSGSNVVVKALKERFNTEGDVDLLAADRSYDIHAVASLFKQYLRELPTTVLTRELHLEFLRVLELDEKQKKIAAFNSLVHRLPSPNLSLLRALAQFLITIVNNCNINKMTVRNVGIVFAPTLNIPAPVFLMFLTDFDTIFDKPQEATVQPAPLTANRSLSAQDIRPPRRQIFSEIATPSYNQALFRNNPAQHGVPEDDLVLRRATGSASMQPNYENMYQPAAPASAWAGHVPSNNMLSPDMESGRTSKAKRRESSYIFMDGKQPCLSFPPEGDNPSPSNANF